MTRCLLTGGAGFIGSHLIERILTDTHWSIVSLDRLDHAGNLARLTEIYKRFPGRLRIAYHDLRAEIGSRTAKDLGKFEHCIHLAAGSHVDRSVQDPSGFVRDNVLGTANLLDFCKDNVWRTLYFSTDEVFGSAAEGQCFKEDGRLNPLNPYAASKAGGELLVPAYANTYNMRLQITRCANVFGEGQDPEKFIPLVIRKVLAHEKVQIHAKDFGMREAGSYCDCHGQLIYGPGHNNRSSKQVQDLRPSSRLYTHHRNVTAAVLKVIEKGEDVGGEDASRGRFNIEGGEELSNLVVAQKIAQLLGCKLNYELVVDPPGRPKPDMRYSIDSSKLRALGWSPEIDFHTGLEQVVRYELKSLER